MNDTAFISTIMGSPLQPGPRWVYADWLEEQGDPRAELLRDLDRLVMIVTSLPVAGDGAITSRNAAIRAVPAQQHRLLAALCARYTPLGGGKVVGDLQTDVRSQRAVTASFLAACGIELDLKDYSADAWAAAAWYVNIRAARAADAAAWSVDARAADAATNAAANAAATTAAAATDDADANAARRWQTAVAQWITSRP